MHFNPCVIPLPGDTREQASYKGTDANQMSS